MAVNEAQILKHKVIQPGQQLPGLCPQLGEAAAAGGLCGKRGMSFLRVSLSTCVEEMLVMCLAQLSGVGKPWQLRHPSGRRWSRLERALVQVL